MILVNSFCITAIFVVYYLRKVVEDRLISLFPLFDKKKMSARPPIPSAIEREVFVEAGHRCCVCGASHPLEFHHIMPWCKHREHEASNLICLCANCHERAHKEKWGTKTLREYKKRPWVMRQNERIETISTRLVVTGELECENFDETKRSWIQHTVAQVLGVPLGNVHIISQS